MEKIASLNDLDYHHTLMDSSGVVLVYFTAPNCGTCRSLKLALTQYLEREKDVVVYEVDAVHNGGLINEFGIFHLPTLYMYLNGEFHSDLQCFALPDAIHEAIQKVIDLPPEEEPS